MRIGWIVPGYQGGADQPGIPALTLLAQELARENEVHVFAVRFPPRNPSYTVAGVPVSSFGAGSVQGNRFQSRAAALARWAAVLAAVQTEHQRAPFAVLHGFWATEAGMLAAVAGRLLGVPVVVSVCGGETASVRTVRYGNRRRTLERAQIALSLRLAHTIGVGSHDTRSRLIARHSRCAAKIVDLPLGYDPAVFSPLGMAPSARRILSVASWSPVKGHPLLLDAMRCLRDGGSPARLLLIGEHTDGAEARAAVAARGLEDWVELWGYQPQPQVAAALRGARVSVIASWHEAQCLAVVESLACGVPVVSTAVGIARTLLTDPRLGRVVPTRSPSRLAEALRHVLDATEGETASDRLLRSEAVADLALPQAAARFEACYDRIQ